MKQSVTNITLLSLFKELSLHPKNAKELKGLILQLAIQGKLTADWRQSHLELISGSNSATELLKKIKAEKAQLIAEKKIKKEKPLSKIAEEEIPYESIEGWAYTRLGEIGDWGAGATPLRSHSEYYGGEINWFKSGELNNDIIDYESSEKITDKALEKTSVRLNKPGDVLIAMYGATIGKTAILKVHGTTNQAVCACTPFSCIKNSYLHLLLKGLKQSFIDQGEGGAQPNISRVKIRNKIFALPPIAEQKAIISTVHHLFTEVEQLEQLTVERISLKEKFAESALRQLTTNNAKKEWSFLQQHFSSFFTEKANIKKLRETILQLAVQGILTANWRRSHPELVSGSNHASELLKRIQAEKAQLIKEKKIKKEKPLPPISKEEIPYELPEGWVWCRLNQLTKVITKGSSPKWQGVQYVEEDEGGILFVTSENVGSYNLLWKKKKYVEAKFNEIEPRSILKRNDLLMNIVGGSIGRTAIYDIDDLANINQAVTIIRLLSDCNYSYFLHFFNSPVCISYMYDKQVDNARPNLSMGNISKFMMPIPPKEEQKVIVEKVNALMVLCDELEQQIDNSQSQIEQLMQSCLKEVFEG